MVAGTRWEIFDDFGRNTNGMIEQRGTGHFAAFHVGDHLGDFDDLESAKDEVLLAHEASVGPRIVGFARDPRMEPKPGDVIERGSKIRRVVSVQHSPFAGKAFVSYKTTEFARGKVSIVAWRLWAASAVVTKVAS